MTIVSLWGFEYNPDIPMSTDDKLKTAGWFERIAVAIQQHTYPDDMKEYAGEVAGRCNTRADELKKEAFAAHGVTVCAK